MLKLEHRWLIAIIVIAVILRLASAIYMGNQVTDLPGAL